MNTQPEALRLADAIGGWHAPAHASIDDCDNAAAELRRLHEIERKYEIALQKGMESYAERWGGFRKTTIRDAEYDAYLSKQVAEFDAAVERAIVHKHEWPTIEQAESKLGKNSYGVRVLRAAIAKAESQKKNPGVL